MRIGVFVKSFSIFDNQCDHDAYNLDFYQSMAKHANGNIS